MATRRARRSPGIRHRVVARLLLHAVLHHGTAALGLEDTLACLWTWPATVEGEHMVPLTVQLQAAAQSPKLRQSFVHLLALAGHDRLDHQAPALIVLHLG